MIKTIIKDAFMTEKELTGYQQQVAALHTTLIQKTGPGHEFLGWWDWPKNYDRVEFDQMKIIGQKIRQTVEVLVVIGIGGSYLGARAGIEMINGLKPANQNVEIIYAGNTLSSTYTSQLLAYLRTKRFAINVISKSGTTTEPAIAFRLLRELLENQVGKGRAKNLIIVTTDKSKGALKALAEEKQYPTFVIPDDIGGRYSVLTPVGIFPMIVAGVDVEAVMAGALAAYNETKTPDLTKNQAYRYAVARYHQYHTHHYPVEMFVTYEPQLTMVAEWWKQLFGESEGKDQKGLLPTSATFTTDLHSLGQFIQDGSKVLFETILTIADPNADLPLKKEANNLDQLNYLANKTLNQINMTACQGTIQAHTQAGKVPNIILEAKKMDAFMFGYFAYFCFKACALSASLLGVNPFNQPGVEIYKHNMFVLLKKPGVK